MPSSQSQFFSASYDSTTKVISLVVCAMLVVVVIATKSVVAAGLGTLLMAVSYAYSPRSYALYERSIIVNRLIGSVRLPIDGIRELRSATADDLRGCIRLFGNGGLFGYYGLFRTSKLGKSTWYVTNRSHAVVVITDAKTSVISPDNVDGLITAVRTLAPIPMAPSSNPIPSSMGAKLRRVAMAIPAIVAVALVVSVMLYSPGPPSYTLTPETLTIHDHFYPVTVNRGAVDVNHIRIVDFDVDTDWRPTERTNGFGSPHYASGWFRVASGKTIRMYRAGGRRLVLLPPKGDGTAVLLETRDPEKLVRELRQQWSSRS